jgi:hypothetical protein
MLQSSQTVLGARARSHVPQGRREGRTIDGAHWHFRLRGPRRAAVANPGAGSDLLSILRQTSANGGRRREIYAGRVTVSKVQQADAQNPAMMRQLHSGFQWRGVCDPCRSATAVCDYV